MFFIPLFFALLQPCSLGSMNGVTVSDPLGRLMCFLTGSEGPYSGEK